MKPPSSEQKAKKLKVFERVQFIFKMGNPEFYIVYQIYTSMKFRLTSNFTKII